LDTGKKGLKSWGAARQKTRPERNRRSKKQRTFVPDRENWGPVQVTKKPGKKHSGQKRDGTA